MTLEEHDAGSRFGTLDSYEGSEKSVGYTENDFIPVSQDSLSTFGLDIDKASYTFHRKKILQENVLPSPEAVRTEEFLNYFSFPAEVQASDAVFAIDAETALLHGRADAVGLRITLKAQEPSTQDAPWNLTFLVDVSGSMESRLDLVKKSIHLMVDAMRAGDKISIATYAGHVSTVLEPTTLAEKDKAALKGIVSDLQSGGGTAMADGLQNAYNVNMKGFIQSGVNRVIVCSDGDANIGASGWQAILEQIRQQKDAGITLSTLGFGIGNYKDANMEMLADRGNGNYYYIDTEAEARRLASEEWTAMMQVVAWDAKIQVAFQSEAVQSYRLLGYENRSIQDTDFVQDTTDAGEIGAGHTVTALYELVLRQPNTDLGTVRIRYRDDKGVTQAVEKTVGAFSGKAFQDASQSFQFAFHVAQYAELLRNSEFKHGSFSEVANGLKGLDLSDTKREEFLAIVETAARIGNR